MIGLESLGFRIYGLGWLGFAGLGSRVEALGWSGLREPRIHYSGNCSSRVELNLAVCPTLTVHVPNSYVHTKPVL